MPDPKAPGREETVVDTTESMSYCDGIRLGLRYLLSSYPEVFVIGQGLWSPWYVGDTMRDLDKDFGVERIMDTPVSEMACTGAAVGASLCGYRAVVVHPRMDFMLLAVDQIVNQAAKWSYMFGGQAVPAVTIRGIINRGGEQGAQHSQALHAWFAHIPGLRVVMPATPRDARDLLIASVLCDDPVLYIDDRWLYDWKEEAPPIVELDLTREGPLVLRQGQDVTLVSASFSTYQALQAAEALDKDGISAEVVDLRVLNPLDIAPVAESVASLKVRSPLLKYIRFPVCGGYPARKMEVTNQSIKPSPLKSAVVAPIPLSSLLTPASRVPSLKVPSPLFQKSTLSSQSAAIARSGQPSPSRSEKRDVKPQLPGPPSPSIWSTETPASSVMSIKCPGFAGPRFLKRRLCDGVSFGF